MKNYRKILKYWVPPVVWAAVIFFFSSLASVKTTEIYWQDFLLKKTAHMIEYGVFAGLLYRAFRSSSKTAAEALFLSLLIAVLYAASDEVHQLFTPGREPTVRDVVFDIIGASLALCLIKVKKI
jgi:VanZ family protein